MSAMPPIHSCTQLTDLNEKLVSRLKKLKKRNNALEQELASINERLKIEKLLREHSIVRHVAVQTEPYPRGSWRVIKQPQSLPQGKSKEAENQKTIDSLLKNHRSLMKRYERELKANTKHIEVIASLNLRIQELEKQLSTAHDRVRLLESQVQRYTPQGWSTPRDKQTTPRDRTRATPRHSGKRMRGRNSYSPHNYSAGLVAEMEALKLERDKLARDKHKLKKELGALDENFFEEIEDLKFALQRSAKLNQEYDKALRHTCQTYGAAFPLDSLPSRPRSAPSSASKKHRSRQKKVAE
ncbi:uncharacterized protein [Diadema setosum]|uniref:uncharacterized protein n=1 Tax=Diadema setosum TaxID=31175 RepID=UPI003B3A7E7E